MVVKNGFRKDGVIESRNNARVYVIDLLDTRRQRLNSMLESKRISPHDFDKETRELIHAIEVVKVKL